MARETHILYEWERYDEVEIMGKLRRYYGGYCSLILHRMDDLKHCPQIPETVLKTPVWWSVYSEKWFLASGQELRLPHKLR